jgi:hypothetical protein
LAKDRLKEININNNKQKWKEQLKK